MTLPEKTIKELLERATSGPWEVSPHDFVTDVLDLDGEEVCHLVLDGRGSENANFIAATPDIAQTCLDLYERVRELEKTIARHKELGIGENL